MIYKKIKIKNQIYKIVSKYDAYYIIRGGVHIVTLCVSLEDALKQIESLAPLRVLFLGLNKNYLTNNK